MLFHGNRQKKQIRKHMRNISSSAACWSNVSVQFRYKNDKEDMKSGYFLSCSMLLMSL